MRTAGSGTGEGCRDGYSVILYGTGAGGAADPPTWEWRGRQLFCKTDTRGHGQSPRGTAPFTIRQFAEDLKGLLDELGITKAHILGFSDGGNIALVFALRYPERVDHLILNGANLNGRGVKAKIQIPIILGYHLAKRLARKDPEARKKAELLGLMVHDPNVAPRELRRIKAPVLVIAGTDDMIKEKHTRKIGAHLPKAHTVFIPGDHFIARKNPEDFNYQVERFLDQ